METFARLLEEHQAAVFRTLARLLGDREELEDLAQEVFLRLFRGIRHFRGDAKASTFLYRIVVNVARDEMRRRERARRGVSLDDEDAGWGGRLVHPGPGADEEMERGQFLAAVEESLRRLNSRERTILTLYFQEGRSYQEISDILELPMGTVKTQLHRARERLKAAVKERISVCRITA